MKQKIVALWMYRNDGGNAIQEKLKKRLEEKNITVINDFDMRECFCKNGRVYTKSGFDLSNVNLFYHMNADEQNQHQNDILRALELSGVKVINSWNAFYTAKNKFMTNVLLTKHGIRVPPALFVTPEEALNQAEQIFKEWGKTCVKPISRHGGKGIVAFDNAESFIDFVEASSEFTNSYYIEKLIDFGFHDYRVEIFRGKVVCAYCRQRTHSFKTNISSKGRFISEIPSQEFQEIALKAAKILDIDTTIVDMVRSQIDHNIYVLEVNPIMGAFVESFLPNTNKIKDRTLYPSCAHDEEKLDLLCDYLSLF